MKCLNWKVVAALTAVGVGLYAAVPGLAAGAAPLLAVAVCPLSMLLMMRAMGSMSGRDTKHHTGETDADEVARLRAEVAQLRQRQSGAASDELAGSG